MKVFDVMCGFHRIGRFMNNANAEAMRLKFIAENELDDCEVEIRERTI